MKSFSRFLIVYILTSFFCIVLAQNVYAEEFDSTVLRNDSQFLTIFLHGLSENYSEQDLDEGDFYGGTSYFSDTLKERTKLGQTNLFYYNFANMANYDSRTFIREIGDFNSGTEYIGEEKNRKPFIALAKCEWVYRNSCELNTKLGKSFWTTSAGEKDMVKLLIKGPRYTDLQIADLGKIPDEKVSDEELKIAEDAAFEYIREKLKPALDDKATTKVAKELYQLATGKYLDVIKKANYAENKEYDNNTKTFGEMVGYQKCPSTIRFVTHSMGGMFVSRYVSEPESSYEPTDGSASGEHGFYQRYQDYTEEEFEKDREIMVKQGKLDENVIKAKLGITDDLLFKNLLYGIFREERQISIDKIVILDSPIAGTPLAKGVQDLFSEAAKIFENEETLAQYTFVCMAATAVNFAIASMQLIPQESTGRIPGTCITGLCGLKAVPVFPYPTCMTPRIIG